MAERVEGRKLVVGGTETDIKYFKGYNVEKKFDSFLLFYDSKGIQGLWSSSH